MTFQSYRASITQCGFFSPRFSRSIVTFLPDFLCWRGNTKTALSRILTVTSQWNRLSVTVRMYCGMVSVWKQSPVSPTLPPSLPPPIPPPPPPPHTHTNHHASCFSHSACQYWLIAVVAERAFSTFRISRGVLVTSHMLFTGVEMYLL